MSRREPPPGMIGTMRTSAKYLVSAFVGLAAALIAIAGMVWGPGRGSLMTVAPVADSGWEGEWVTARVPASAGQVIASTSLMGVFTAALLAVAAIALFVVVAAVRAVMRVSVERSAAEIGLRMAVGATPAKIRTLVIRRSLHRLAWGTVMGIFVGLVFLGQLQRVIPEIPRHRWSGSRSGRRSSPSSQCGAHGARPGMRRGKIQPECSRGDSPHTLGAVRRNTGKPGHV